MENGKMKNFESKKAFTLAEVLITLGIIGVVAAMTIPTLMNNIQEEQYKTGYKKAYSTASQAWSRAISDDKISSRTSWTESQTKIDNFNAFKSYFKIAKECINNDNTTCWPTGEMYYSSYPDSGAIAFIDTSGFSWSMTSQTAGGAEILVDVNGLKKPNKFGQDRFILYPFASDGNSVGFPSKISIRGDLNYDVDRCPSGNTHPCYYTSWILGN